MPGRIDSAKPFKVGTLRIKLYRRNVHYRNVKRECYYMRIKSFSRTSVPSSNSMEVHYNHPVAEPLLFLLKI